ncbi:MAG: host attachment protein [Steroidobacteraceae bacterium]|jgi:protein required for attachment to host cells|nr:host attachment protein [Steroidobacteraceae bacterium]
MLHALVADSKVVRVFAEAGDSTVREVATFRNPNAAPHERDLVTDRPGRTLNTAANVHQAFEPRTSARRLTTQRWLKSLGPQLQAVLAAQNSEGVVLVAAARLLPQLRSSLSPRARTLIRAELARDLTKLPIDSLNKRLQPSLREVRRESALQRPRVVRFARTGAPAG